MVWSGIKCLHLYRVYNRRVFPVTNINRRGRFIGKSFGRGAFHIYDNVIFLLTGTRAPDHRVADPEWIVSKRIPHTTDRPVNVFRPTKHQTSDTRFNIIAQRWSRVAAYLCRRSRDQSVGHVRPRQFAPYDRRNRFRSSIKRST